MEEFDVFDVENIEKYEKAIESLSEMDNLEGLTMTESVKEQCRIIFDFFNTIYGIGADKKIFGDRVNLVICIKALGEFISNINEQRREIEKINQKYSPSRIRK